MRTFTTTAAALCAAALLVGCSSEPTQDEIVTACVEALKVRAEGDKAKPEECNGLSEDDYTTLVMSHVIDELGWTDEDGNFDKNKMLEDAIEGEDQP